MLLSLLMAVAATVAGDADPFAGPPRGAIDTLIQAAQFGDPGSDAAIERWLKGHVHAKASERMRLYRRLCADRDVHGDYAAAALACANAAALGADEAQSAANNKKLRNSPTIHTIGSARVELTPNGVGSRDATVTVNGVSVPWLMDTGAQITVVSQSLADKIKVRYFEGGIEVASTTSNVHGGMGLIDLLWIGKAAVENVPVLVLPDSQLKIGELPQIQAILGLPVMVAFRRAEWLDRGHSLLLGDEAQTVPASNPRLYWHAEGIGIPMSTARGIRGAHLDTGANESYLRAPAHELLDPAMEAAAVTHKGRRGGAGGVVDIEEKVYPTLQLSVAGASLELKKVSINEQDHEGAARLGDDVIRQLSVLALDFEHMRVEARK
jgi:predicted aspartyl protease